MKIVTTSVTQEANKVLDTAEKKLYYLIIQNNKGRKMIVNVGKKTHDDVLALNMEEDGTQKLPI